MVLHKGATIWSMENERWSRYRPLACLSHVFLPTSAVWARGPRICAGIYSTSRPPYEHYYASLPFGYNITPLTAQYSLICDSCCIVRQVLQPTTQSAHSRGVGIITGYPGVFQAAPNPDPTKTRTRTQGGGFAGLGSGFFGSAGSTTGIGVGVRVSC